MLRKILIWLGVAGLVLVVVGYGRSYFRDRVKEVVLTPSMIDIVEDIRVTGYPDSRKIAVDGQGHIFVAYRKHFQQIDTTQQHIFVARSVDDGQSWQISNDNKPVEAVGDYNQRVPSIAVDDADVIHVVWYGNDAENDGENERQIKYVQSTDGGQTWSDWRNLAEITGYEADELWQEHPTIYTHEQAVYVVWQGRDAEYKNSQTRFVRSLDGGATWSSWVNISPDPTTNFSRPALVAASDGVLYVLAYSAVKGVQQIVWSRSNDGGITWAAWKPVAGAAADQRHFSVVVDGEDNLHLVWRQEDDLTARIYYALFNGRSWTPSSPLTIPSTTYQYFPSAALDEGGNLVVVWMETAVSSGFPSERPENGRVLYAVKTETGWSDSQQLTDNGLYPSIATVSSGAAVIWLQRSRDSGGKIIYHQLLPPPQS